MNLLQRLATLLVIPSLMIVGMFSLTAMGSSYGQIIPVFSLRNVVGVLGFLLSTSFIIINYAPDSWEKPFSTITGIIFGMVGAAASATLLSPAIVPSWIRFGMLLTLVLGIPMITTCLSGYRRVPAGQALLRNREIRVQGERYYYIPILMGKPTFIPTNYSFGLEGKVLGGGERTVLCVFTCDIDPHEVAKENIHFGALPELLMKEVRDRARGALSGGAMHIGEALEHLLPLLGGFSLPQFGRHAKGRLINLAISSK